MLVMAISVAREGPTASVKGRTPTTFLYAKGYFMGITNPFQIGWWMTAGTTFIGIFGPASALGLFSAISAWILVFPQVINRSGKYGGSTAYVRHQVGFGLDDVGVLGVLPLRGVCIVYALAVQMFVTFKRLKLPSTMGDVERSILEVLSSGEAYQSNIVKATGFSRSRVSEVMSRLEKEGIIGRVAEGRNKRVYLKSNPVSRRPKGLIRLGLIRSAEYPFVIPFKKALRDMGFELEIEVFPNGIDVMKALSNGQLELGIAPMITQLYFFSAEFPIQILAPAGAGGSSVLALPSLPTIPSPPPRNSPPWSYCSGPA